MIGRTRFANLFLNTGHGTLGWTLACGSGQALADIVSRAQAGSGLPLHMRTSESQFLQIRELRYHVRRWPRPGAPKMVLLHGWMDVSASFQFMVDALQARLGRLRARLARLRPDGMGKARLLLVCGLHRRPGFSPAEAFPKHPVNLVGHSLGGNVAALYAGTRPERDRQAGQPGRLRPARDAAGAGAAGATRSWLEELREPPQLRPYAGFAELAERLQKGNKRG